MNIVKNLLNWFMGQTVGVLVCCLVALIIMLTMDGEVKGMLWGVFRHGDDLGYTFHCFKCGEKTNISSQTEKERETESKTGFRFRGSV